MNETTQLKKLMEAMTYDGDRDSGLQDDTRMMFGASEDPVTVLTDVDRILRQFGLRIKITTEDGSVYGRIKKAK